MFFKIKITWNSYFECADTSLCLYKTRNTSQICLMTQSDLKLVFQPSVKATLIRLFNKPSVHGGFLCPPSLLLSPSWVPSEVCQRGTRHEWNYSQVTQSACIVLHTVDRAETWRHFFRITLQSPWRCCRRNCAARLAPAPEGWPQFLTDACGISIRQGKILPLNWQLLERTKQLGFLFEFPARDRKLRCFLNWHEWVCFFHNTWCKPKRISLHSERFKWCIPVMCSIQAYTTFSAYGFRHYQVIRGKRDLDTLLAVPLTTI